MAQHEVAAGTLNATLAGWEACGIDAPDDVRRAIHLARALQQQASELQTSAERRQQAELDRMMQTPADKATLTLMTDQAFRSATARRAADQLVHVLDIQGVPRFFTAIERTLLRGFQSFGAYLPGVAMPLVRQNMRKETANVILPAERDILGRHLRRRNEQGLRMNVNFLGEALLGEDEAHRRLERYLQALADPDIEVISVKISTIYSQISALAHEHTVAVLSDRLARLYRAAAAHEYRRNDGSVVPKFVYLDMEEYRDMNITAGAFMRALQQPGLERAGAGIALQAYLPDAWLVQQRLTDWARRRVQAGGAPITLRIVKGANMEMERVDASLHGWPQAPYRSKVETDANYKRMLRAALHRDNAAILRVGIASHNLFELAYGLIVALDNDALDRIQMEMLEGMANGQRRALADMVDDVLLYAPAARRQDFLHAIGYLIRRLDENTGPDNFLAHAFRLDPGGADWQRLQDQFVASALAMDTVSFAPRRTQDRSLPPEPPRMGNDLHEFVNEPDTDFSLPQNVAWAEALIADWHRRCAAAPVQIPVVVAGVERLEARETRECRDPSRPGAVVAHYRQADASDIESALACAAADPSGWRSLAVDERSRILADVAQSLREARATLMGAALAEGGKTLAESDPEVSEAVDFVEFYRRTASEFQRLPGVAAQPLGAVVVVSPWNFPIAIPCGGVAAALAAGNTVILKPASDTVLTAWELCSAFWRAGVPREALQFVPCTGASGGAQLVGDTRVDAVILTGGTDTARAMLAQRPDVNLLAETGGKDATIVTALADRELATKHVLHSAFSHGGQKCSATSLLVLEAEVYDDPEFRAAFCDAVRSLRVGSAWDLSRWMGPLIRPPDGALARALDNLEEGESWAVEPRSDPDNPQLLYPGVKWGVRPGSFTHMTELFGPVLAVMRADNLEHAIEIVNQTGYGLTSGLESLDDREQSIWAARLRAGNLYVNRSTTGAVVLRQPFGGMGKSAFGSGIKAGGPNYVAQFMRFDDAGASAPPVALSDPLMAGLERALQRESGLSAHERARLRAAACSYEQAWNEEFGHAHDTFRLVGQDNYRRYLPVAALRIRVTPRDSLFEIAARILAARRAGCGITVSHAPEEHGEALQLVEDLTQDWAGAIEFVEESDAGLVAAIRGGGADRVRFAHREFVPDELWRTVGETGVYLATAPVSAAGRLEMLWYLREQSLCVDYHRYGNLGPRAAEPRAPVA